MRYKIIFFGTSKFATPSLELLSKYHNLLAVVSSPNPSPVREIAHKLGIKIFTPLTPNSKEFIEILKKLTPDIICLSAYGHILSEEILSIPRITGLNLHPSLLPLYRGAAPIQWAIINDEKYTGVTTFIMDPKVDRGNILLQKKIKILPEETYGELEARLSKIGAKLLLETVNRLEELTPVPQSNSIATYAPKISKELRKINWQDGAKKIVNLIRALSPKPTAYTFFRGKRIEILKASVINMDGEPGKIVESKKRLIIGTGDKCIELKIVKPEAKREQTGVDFINGYKPQIGESMGGEDERENRN